MGQPPKPPINVIAIISLVLGILSIPGTCFTGIPAVICGHWALAQLRAEAGGQRGDNLARFGLLFGYFGIAIAFLFAASIALQMFAPNAPSAP